MLPRLLLVLCAFTFSVFAEETYDIRIVRPMKAGDRFDVSAKVAFEDAISTTFDGAPIEDEKTIAACRLKGDLSIVSVTLKGLPKEVRLKLKTVECVDDGKPAEFFKAGDELHLLKEEPDNVVEVNGQAADDVQAQIIESLLSVEKEGEVTDDDVFGTAEKMKVGAEWPVNQKAALADLSRNGVNGVAPEGIKGSTKLVKVTAVENQPALQLRMETKIDAKEVSFPSLPEGVKAKRFHTEFSEEIDIPVDAAATSGRSKGMVRMEVDAAGKAERGGAMVEIGVKIRRRVATEVTAIVAK